MAAMNDESSSRLTERVGMRGHQPFHERALVTTSNSPRLFCLKDAACQVQADPQRYGLD